MPELFNGIGEWIKQCLIDAIMASFTGIFDDVNQQVNDIAVQVGQTPEGWNSGVYTMVRTLSETVVIPIAGMVLTFVLCYELIQMIIEKNNLSDFDTFNVYKWIFKTFAAVYILTNTFSIVTGVFGLAQNAVNHSAGLITGGLNIGNDVMVDTIQTQLEAMEIGELIGIFLETGIIKICIMVMSIAIFIIVWGRMIEIYLTVSIAPIPFSTMANKEWGGIGTNYIKGLFALAFQGFLIMVCVAIYGVLISSVGMSDNIHGTIWSVAGYTALLVFILLKSGSLSKSVFSAG